MVVPLSGVGASLLGPEHILTAERYEAIRPAYLQRITALRRRRRLPIGPNASLSFENAEMVLFQLHELLRTEGRSATRVAREIDNYRPLLPRSGELRATVMIDAGAREDCLWLARELHARPDILALAGPGFTAYAETTEWERDATSLVKYLCFRMSPPSRDALAHLSASVHLHCRPRTVITPLPASLCAELSSDLSRPCRRRLTQPALHADSRPGAPIIEENES